MLVFGRGRAFARSLNLAEAPSAFYIGLFVLFVVSEGAAHYSQLL